MTKKNILLINTTDNLCGAEICVIHQYKALLKNGYKATIIVPQKSKIAEKLKEENLQFYSYNKIKIFNINIQPGLSNLVYNTCQKHNIDIIHCTRFHEIYYAKKASKKLNIKIIVTRHTHPPVKKKYLKMCNGIIGVNKQIEQQIKKKCIQQNIYSPKITVIPPFFDDEKFSNFITTRNKNTFFLDEFNINLPSLPTLCMVANLYNDQSHKNHPFLFKAINKLTYEKDKPVNVLLCGEGPAKNYLQNLVKHLKIEKFVYFLGFTDKRIEVMFHSDINLLTSKQEAFGIVMMEAGLLKKPLIGPTNTGIENIVIHEKTGLLFENNNIDDLIQKIEKLIDNPDLQKKYGNNACEYIKNNLIADLSTEKLNNFYNSI